MKEIIYNAIVRARDSFDQQCCSVVFYDGMLTHDNLTPHYKVTSKPDKKQFVTVDYFSTTYTPKKKNSSEGTNIVLKFAETKLGDVVYTVTFCNQIKFSGIKAADAPDLQEWVEKVLGATKTFAVAISKFMNTDI
jgi:hypothetical protein